MPGTTGEDRRSLLAHVLQPVANEEDATATAIAYRPRGGGRLVQLLSSDRSQQLLAEASLPVIDLPRAGTG